MGPMGPIGGGPRGLLDLWTYGPSLESDHETKVDRPAAEIDLVAEEACVSATGVAAAEQIASLDLERVDIAAEWHAQAAKDQCTKRCAGGRELVVEDLERR